MKKKCEGENMTVSKSETVKLVSAEGFEFIIDRKAATVSNTLRNMLSSSGLCLFSFPFQASQMWVRFLVVAVKLGFKINILLL
jgi:hypothetical protein